MSYNKISRLVEFFWLLIIIFFFYYKGKRCYVIYFNFVEIAYDLIPFVSVQ